jgi:membrane-bound lytic murein transglycosylase B
MLRLTLSAALLVVAFSSGCTAERARKVSLSTPSKKQTLSIEAHTTSQYRGWDYLVRKLRAQGVTEQDISSLYQDPRMPLFNFIPFSASPREHSSMYSGFATRSNFALGAAFAREYQSELDHLEKTLNIPREVVIAILLVESHLGRNTGDHVVAYRLSRVASVAEPGNLERNYQRLIKGDPSITREQVVARAAYLEKVFLPEIPALIEIGKRNRINPLSVKGSVAGAFGLPQFLPSAFLRFGVDGNRDGYVSLYNNVDAMWSAANYLASYGYHFGISLEQKRAIIWKYNKSDAYIDTILNVARGIKAVL